MDIALPKDYVEACIMKYSGFPVKKRNGSINACCNICREGKSWGKKKRLFYMPDKNYLFCHNCNGSWSPFYYIKASSGMDYAEIIKESKDYDFTSWETKSEEDIIKKENKQTLPYESINLYNKEQLKYYESDKNIQMALKYIHDRRLDTAINSINLFISLKDYIHKNRLIIPFYDVYNNIKFYQSRSIWELDYRPKYLSKMDSDKTVFGINKIDSSFGYVFIFEGPIDSMFVKNGVAVGGLKITEAQKEELDKIFTFKKIWVLDNDIHNPDVKNKYNELVERGETIFLWPKAFSKIKDLNQLCCETKKDSVNPDFFIKNSFSGRSAKIQINMLNQ